MVVLIGSVKYFRLAMPLSFKGCLPDPYRNARVYIGIDPGPKTLGLVVYCVPKGKDVGVVALADGKMSPTAARYTIAALANDHPIVVLEHTHPGPPSWSVIHTTVMLGRIWEYASIHELQVHAAHRKDVKKLLGSSDSAIRRRRTPSAATRARNDDGDGKASASGGRRSAAHGRRLAAGAPS